MRKFVVLITFLVAFSMCSISFAEDVDLSVPLTILVTDPHIQVVDTWKPIWEAQTGGKINVVLVPYATVEEKMWVEFQTQAGSFDLACIRIASLSLK